MKPNSYVFESNRFLLFRMYAETEIYYAICDKRPGKSVEPDIKIKDTSLITRVKRVRIIL